MHGELGNQHHGDRVVRKTPCHGLWQGSSLDFGMRQGVIRTDTGLIFPGWEDHGLTDARLLVTHGKLLEKSVQYLSTAIE